jgi:putative MATE family efflux protein
MLSISLYNLVDTFWVAKLGYRAVAALTVIMPLWVFILAVAAGTGVGISALTSRRFGERNVPAAHQAAGQSYFLSVLLGSVFLVTTVFFTRQILIICGATPDILPFGIEYLSILAWGMPFIFAQLIFRNVFNAAGDAVLPMVYTIFGQVLNAILDPLLIFGWGFFPEMGIRGAALATVIANVLSTVLALVFIFGNKTPYRFRPAHLAPNWRALFDIYRVGLPAMLMQVTEGLVFVIFNRVVAGYGSVALAAMGIAGRISDFAFMFIIGASHGLLTVIGYSYGAKLWRRLWGSVKLVSLWLMGVMGIATILLEIFAAQIIALFNDDPELLRIAVPGMRIFISTLVLIGPAIVFITTFQGLSKGKDAMVLSLARQFIFFVPALFLLSGTMGLTGIWLSLPVSDILGVTASGLWLYREYRLQKKSGEWKDSPGVPSG